MRGSTAKINVENKIREAFGDDFIGTVDKKIIVEADDGGEKVQIAISLTCPKTNFAVENKHSEGLDFESMSSNQDQKVLQTFKAAEVTEDEITNIRKMLKVLDL